MARQLSSSLVGAALTGGKEKRYRGGRAAHEPLQRQPPELARQMDERTQEQLHVLTTLGELQLVEIDYCGDPVLSEPAREQRGVEWPATRRGQFRSPGTASMI